MHQKPLLKDLKRPFFQVFLTLLIRAFFLLLQLHSTHKKTDERYQQEQSG